MTAALSAGNRRILKCSSPSNTASTSALITITLVDWFWGHIKMQKTSREALKTVLHVFINEKNKNNSKWPHNANFSNTLPGKIWGFHSEVTGRLQLGAPAAKAMSLSPLRLHCVPPWESPLRQDPLKTLAHWQWPKKKTAWYLISQWIWGFSVHNWHWWAVINLLLHDYCGKMSNYIIITSSNDSITLIKYFANVLLSTSCLRVKNNKQKQ